jgi:hypothetical protein
MTSEPPGKVLSASVCPSSHPLVSMSTCIVCMTTLGTPKTPIATVLTSPIYALVDTVLLIKYLTVVLGSLPQGSPDELEKASLIGAKRVCGVLASFNRSCRHDINYQHTFSKPVSCIQIWL